MNSDVELLKRARELISLAWCQKAFALDGQGNVCSSTSSTAVKWDIIGAVHAAAVLSDSNPFKLLAMLQKQLIKSLHGANVSLLDYNDRDTTTKQDLRVLLDKTIEQLEWAENVCHD